MGLRSRIALRTRARTARTHAAALRAFRRGSAYACAYAERGRWRDAPAPRTDLEEYFDGIEEGPGIWKWRHYFPIYDRHFAAFRNRRPQVVEIGIYSGGSLPMWHSYFGAGTTVYGVDIEPDCRAYEAPGTQVFIGDQADPAFWASFVAAVPSFDVVVDDGGHGAEQQITTFEALFPHLAPGGVFLIEDIHSPGHPTHAFLDGAARELHSAGAPAFRFEPNAWQRSVASIHTYPFVTVVEKSPSPPALLEAPRHGTEWQPFYER